MKFTQSAILAVAVADIEPLKRLNTLVRSRLRIFKRSKTGIHAPLGASFFSLVLV